MARAQTETVRALEVAVRAVGPADISEEEGWELVCVPLSPEGRAKLDQALELAGKHLGPGAPRWQRLEAICQEYLAAHPVEPLALRLARWQVPWHEHLELLDQSREIIRHDVQQNVEVDVEVGMCESIPQSAHGSPRDLRMSFTERGRHLAGCVVMPRHTGFRPQREPGLGSTGTESRVC